MLKAKTLTIENIYVPTKRRRMLELTRVEKIAESVLERGQTTPILVRENGQRFVLIEGFHRLEACKALGEEDDTRVPSPSPAALIPEDPRNPASAPAGQQAR